VVAAGRGEAPLVGKQGKPVEGHPVNVARCAPLRLGTPTTAPTHPSPVRDAGQHRRCDAPRLVAPSLRREREKNGVPRHLPQLRGRPACGGHEGEVGKEGVRVVAHGHALTSQQRNERSRLHERTRWSSEVIASAVTRCVCSCGGVWERGVRRNFTRHESREVINCPEASSGKESKGREGACGWYRL